MRNFGTQPEIHACVTGRIMKKVQKVGTVIVIGRTSCGAWQPTDHAPISVIAQDSSMGFLPDRKTCDAKCMKNAHPVLADLQTSTDFGQGRGLLQKRDMRPTVLQRQCRGQAADSTADYTEFQSVYLHDTRITQKRRSHRPRRLDFLHIPGD